MREAKRQYLYANRRNKRKEDQLRKERMAEDICNNRSREFFKEVKKSYPKCGIAPGIDDQVESGVIADNFANKYDDLYNSVPSDIDRLQARIQDSEGGGGFVQEFRLENRSYPDVHDFSLRMQVMIARPND